MQNKGKSAVGPHGEISFDIKKYSWIPIYGFIVGFCSRKIFETTNQFIAIEEYSVFDLESITYGVIFIALAAIVTGITIDNERHFGRFAKYRYHLSKRAEHSWKSTVGTSCVLLCLSIKHSWLRYIFNGIFIFSITNDFKLSAVFAVSLSATWPLMAFSSRNESKYRKKSRGLFMDIIEIGGIPWFIITTIAILATYFGYAIITYVPQSLGGAKCQNIKIHFRESTAKDSLPANRYNHHAVELLYKQGSILWIKGINDSMKYTTSKSDIGSIETIHVKK